MRSHKIDFSLCLLLNNQILSDNRQHRGESSSISTTQDSATAGHAVTSKTIDVRWILRDCFVCLFMLTNDMKRGNCFQQSGKVSAERVTESSLIKTASVPLISFVRLEVVPGVLKGAQ